jgi:hypothetical protein
MKTSVKKNIDVSTIEYILSQRKYTKELYNKNIAPSSLLSCGLKASTLAFYTLKLKTDSKKKKKSRILKKRKIRVL